ncbi:hypothetical protein CDL12_15098 [Handroanthus impetiginosus]|uniref:WRKY domain-containing protein n=1 Tax=Handroanthus impetiginosus TaxID=429701 RepID=A0A2G9H446_9LAMI|nr:hypothetical protein CDL12_15098 [Handroanthus impetiginosus]
MESESLKERKALENEITKGMEQVKQLRASSSGNEESALERMLTSYEEALLILQEIASDEQGQSVMSLSSDAPGPSKDSNIISIPSRVNTYRRREAPPVWTNQIRVTSNDKYETALDDGYSWRKYGQKDILGFKYPRSYYRCAYSHGQGCLATKQVQRSNDDPFTFEVTYRGEHTCIGQAHVAAPQRRPS